METRGKKRARELIENWEEEKPSKKLERNTLDEKTRNDDSPKKINKVKRQSKSIVSTKSNQKKGRFKHTKSTLVNLPEHPLYKDEEYLNSIKVSFTLDPNSFRPYLNNFYITDDNRKFNSSKNDGSWSTCKGCIQFSEGIYYYEVESYLTDHDLYVFFGVVDSKVDFTQVALPYLTKNTHCPLFSLIHVIGDEVNIRKFGILVDMINREFALFTEKKRNF